ncbi:MAG: 4-phosphoerythronate dehydrogenase PdxB [Bacteroidales bacterium]|nr:4-phosphoerythronate dehydrogenase PdxB [Bacteroidales bacterium]MBN2632812.1 4-phosphoerythronate dehydrogenase PdxB [Bacteroidales bacterium]
MKIVADDKIPFLKGVLEPYAEVLYLPGGKITRKDISDADALLVRTRTKCTEELLGGTRVSFIATATIGFDHIDTRFCKKNGIAWTNAPGCNSSSVQQYVAAALLKMASEFRFSLKGKTIGIIGVGNVGSKVEKLAGILGMNILLNDPPRARKENDAKFTDLRTVLGESDIITLHVPLNVVGRDATWHLISEKSLKKMKKGAWIINSSRGEVADTAGLYKVLSSGKPGGAVLDVWENEPDIDLELMSKTFIATPHIAGYSTDGKANGTSMAVNALCRHFSLPITEWYPEDLPFPGQPEIKIDGTGKSDEEILHLAVNHSYNIDEDNINLRFAPSDFERQRGEYRVRREFPAYTVKLSGASEKVSGMLDSLGFNVV